MASFLSVGIDIGTSTTQVIFSRITMDNKAGYFTAPRISITDKEIVYAGKIYTTPLISDVMIDGEKAREIVAEEYRRAGFRPEDIATGAAIITGESARKENSQVVLDLLSGFAGEFVVSTAGPDLESVIAGKGSGAFTYSIDNDCRVYNLDIGGGTTNIVLFDSGETVGKTCYDVGGRLVRVDNGRITYVAEAAAKAAKAAGLEIRAGDPADQAALSRLTDVMASVLAEAIGLNGRFANGGMSDLAEAIRTKTGSRLIPPGGRVSVCFSGGVADCIYNEREDDPFIYGDIGPLLGASIRRHAAFKAAEVIPAGETIRATVVGAGTHTITLSGSTITYAPGIFPLKNVPVLRLSDTEQTAVLGGDEGLLEERVRWFLSQSDSESLLLAMTGPINPTWKELQILGRTIVRVFDRLLAPGEPIIVVVEQDIAKALGIAMQQAIGERRRTAAIDSVKVEDHDFVDIGSPMMNGLVVPMIVKTLIFG